jgi:hypothetical protein
VAQIEMAYRVHEELEHAIVFFPSIANEILEGFSLSAVLGLSHREEKLPNSPSNSIKKKREFTQAHSESKYCTYSPVKSWPASSRVA